MRLLKFRALVYDKDRGKSRMVYGDDYGQPYIMEQSEIMQFTGLVDKHGEEIYEGDIICHRLGVDPVEWVASAWRAGDGSPSNLEELNDWDPVEIVGDIHENPVGKPH